MTEEEEEEEEVRREKEGKKRPEGRGVFRVAEESEQKRSVQTPR